MQFWVHDVVQLLDKDEKIEKKEVKKDADDVFEELKSDRNAIHIKLPGWASAWSSFLVEILRSSLGMDPNPKLPSIRLSNERR